MSKKVIAIILGVVVIIAVIVGAVWYFQKDNKQIIKGKCGDGVCNLVEKNNPNLCPKDCKNNDSSATIPYYFIAVHAEPNGAISKNFDQLKKIIEKANQYKMKLTLMFTPAWVDFILSDPVRKADLESWAQQGHEIAAQHHSLYHPGGWDGYSYFPKEEAIAERNRYYQETYGKVPDAKLDWDYQGNLEDFMTKLKKLNTSINSGCMNDDVSTKEMPDGIIYDTCSGYANHGEPGRKNVTELNFSNEFISVGIVNGIERKWLAHGKITTEEEKTRAIKAFNSMNQKTVFGGVVHANEQVSHMIKFMDFLHEKDPTGEKSKTVSQVIEQKLLSEKILSKN